MVNGIIKGYSKEDIEWEVIGDNLILKAGQKNKIIKIEEKSNSDYVYRFRKTKVVTSNKEELIKTMQDEFWHSWISGAIYKGAFI